MKNDGVDIADLAAKALAKEAALQIKLVWGDEDNPSFDDVCLYIQPNDRSTEIIMYNVEYLPQLTRNKLVDLINRPPDELSNVIVTTEFVERSISKILREHQIQFMDTAGNFFLQHAGMTIHVYGNSPIRPSAHKNPLFTPRSLRVILFFLYKPDLLNHVVRAAAQTCGVSNATIDKVRKTLKNMNFLEDKGRLGCKLVNIERLHCLWATGFNNVLRPKLVMGHFSTSVEGWEKQVLLPKGVYWGGELADKQGDAKRLSREIYIYSDSIPDKMFSKYRIMPDTFGNISVIKTSMDEKINIVRLGKVHPAFVFADLWACEDDECRERAMRLLQRELPRP